MSETIAGIKIPAVLNELLILTQSSVFGFSHGLGPQLPRLCETARPQLAKADTAFQALPQGRKQITGEDDFRTRPVGSPREPWRPKALAECVWR